MILLLDNQDSFVHNLARYFRRLGLQTTVVRSDQVDLHECKRLTPDAIVISPGPRRPEDAGYSLDIIQHFDPRIPILGVCLGHQAIAVAMGATIVQCDPVHGMSSEITHCQTRLFHDCPNPMRVGRYHSLAIDPQSMPANLQVTAQSSDGVIMAIKHTTRPLFGVQFHPESILSDHGQRVIKNFAAITKRPREKAAR